MDDIGLVILGAAVILGIPILAIAAFIMANSQRGRLQLLAGRIERLEREIAILRTARRAPVEPMPAPPVKDEAPAAPAVPAMPEPVFVPAPEQPEPVAAVAAAAAPVPPTPRPQPTPKAPKPPRPSLEERLGARWAVWVGGVALALGGAFLVRYSIDEGLIGPGLRIIAGLLFALALIAAGEFLRRRDRAGIDQARAAYIPGVVTAAGTASLFSIIYAAYALYGFIDGATAFIVLGAVGVATMAAAALHGPWLAGLGLIGAYGTPLLIETNTPRPWALVIFLLVITACAFLLSRLRLWRWLALASLLLASAWGALIVLASRLDLAPAATFIAVLTGLVALVLIIEPQRGRAAGARVDGTGLFALATVGLLAFAFAQGEAYADLPLAPFLLAIALDLALAIAFDAVAPAACLAALGLVGLAFGWPVESASVTSVAGSLGFEPQMPVFLERYLTIGGLGAALLFAATAFALLRRARAVAPALALALAGTAGPVLILAIAYVRITGFGFSLPWALIALGAAFVYALATETLSRAELSGPSGVYGPGSGLQAGAASAMLALGLTMLIEGSPLTLAFALAALAVAWVSLWRPLPALRWCAASLTLLVVVRFGGVELLAGEGLTDFPGWRDIVLRFALPALAIGLGGLFLRRRAVDTPAAILDSGGIALGTAAAAFAIRLYCAGKEEALSAPVGLAEAGLYTALAFGMALGFARSALRTTSVIHRVAAPVAAAGAVVVAVLLPMLASNPALQGVTLESSLLANALLPGYALPAVLAALVALTWQHIAAGSNPVLARLAGSLAHPLGLAAGACGLALAFLYVTFETRLVVNSPDMSYWVITAGENYAYSAVWLGFGILLLAAGLVVRSKALRLASAPVLLLTVAKVFLFDLSGLEGVWRALSFIGLGLVLIGIGLVYQRLLFGTGSPSKESASPPTQA